MRWNRSVNGLPPRQDRRRAGPLNPKGLKRNIIVIGASAGGVTALQRLFAAFPEKLPATVGVVLHRGTGPSELEDVLRHRSALPLIEPDRETTMRQGVIYLAPPDHHLLFESGRVVVQRGPKEHSTRPAVDPLFRSAAAHYGNRVVGVLLTGCGEDGVSGLIAITSGNGLSLAQDPEEAYMPYMPLNALRYDEVAATFTLDHMAKALAALAEGKNFPYP